MSYYPQTIANKMEKGLTKEIEMYAAISKALREDGNSKSQVSYYMSVDEDFIPDVLQAYACQPASSVVQYTLTRTDQRETHEDHCNTHCQQRQQDNHDYVEVQRWALLVHRRARDIDQQDLARRK